MKFRSVLVVIVAVSIPALAFAEYYKLNVKRVDQDLYKTTTDGLYIQTRHCHEHTHGDDVILKYEDFGHDNKLIFNSNTTCDVVKVFK